ncbi:hypothetical protein D3C87_175470 [compost metagenome]
MLRSDYQKSRTAMRIVLALMLLSQIGCENPRKDSEIGIDDFLRRKYQAYFVVLGEISNLNKMKYSNSFYQIKSVRIAADKTLGKAPKDLVYEPIDCAIISDLNMIAPFEQQILDKPLNLIKDEHVVAYLGIDGSQCEVVHLSKIEGTNIAFPAYKGQGEHKISMEDFKRLVEKGFKLNVIR